MAVATSNWEQKETINCSEEASKTTKTVPSALDTTKMIVLLLATTSTSGQMGDSKRVRCIKMLTVNSVTDVLFTRKMALLLLITMFKSPKPSWDQLTSASKLAIKLRNKIYTHLNLRVMELSLLDFNYPIILDPVRIFYSNFNLLIQTNLCKNDW